MRAPNRLSLVLLLAACPALAMAVDDEAPSAEPDVTISKDGENFIQEYKANGFVYAVKITPKHGKPYYLVRADGTSGQFIRSDQPDMLIPQWVLFSW
ncbi:MULTISPECIES: DUF2782 domain-containing protein [unclassified Pseudomonas]|jgi:hypothetical protein|uniref:DUF2782 domain-containing protein n=1 Tax=unclassified Pseudomonas TaxID=196821 RepID=UPI0008C56DFB|nr:MULTISPECIES: DUF2782 domain-containing protein [unclassified Pseudomonas]SEJ72307.1 Protein of unknown function [Pseudomonas sp. NFR16]